MSDNTVSKPRLGIIISMFPELHETFILRELVALERRGLQFDIFSLQFPRDPITIDDAIRLSEERTHYSSLINAKTLAAFVSTLARKPLRLLSAMVRVVWHGRDRPDDIVKNLAILPITLYFAKLGAERQITHWHGHWANIPTTSCWYMQQLFDDSWSAAIHGEDIFSANKFLRYKLDAAEFGVVCSGYFCNHLQHQLGLNRPKDIHLNYHGLDPRVMARTKKTEDVQVEQIADQGNEHSVNNTIGTNQAKTVQLVSIGRLVPTKGHDVLIKACSLLKHEFNLSFSLQLIGSGPIENELKALVRIESVAEEVIFRGGLAFEEVLSTLENADAFCLAPRLIPGHPPDGIPNVIAESMALRVPVISTRVSAIPELIEDGKTGRLVKVDDVRGLAQAIFDVVSNPELAQRIRSEGYDKVAVLFDQQRNIDELLEYFEHYVPGRVLPLATIGA